MLIFFNCNIMQTKIKAKINKNTAEFITRRFMDSLQLEALAFALVKYSDRGSCLYRCGNKRYYLLVIAPPYR